MESKFKKDNCIEYLAPGAEPTQQFALEPAHFAAMPFWRWRRELC